MALVYVRVQHRIGAYTVIQCTYVATVQLNSNLTLVLDYIYSWVSTGFIESLIKACVLFVCCSCSITPSDRI